MAQPRLPRITESNDASDARKHAPTRCAGWQEELVAPRTMRLQLLYEASNWLKQKYVLRLIKSCSKKNASRLACLPAGLHIERLSLMFQHTEHNTVANSTQHRNAVAMLTTVSPDPRTSPSPWWQQMSRLERARAPETSPKDLVAPLAARRWDSGHWSRGSRGPARAWPCSPPGF